MAITNLGAVCVEIGERNHIKQCDWVIIMFVGEGLCTKIIPIITPAEIIVGAMSLIGEQKLGSIKGAQKNQLVMAPPLMAMMVRILILII